MSGAESISEFAEFIAKPVKLEVVPGGVGPTTIYGNVYTVDPVSGDVILMRFDSNGPTCMSWFPRAAVRSVSLVEETRADCRAASVEMDEMMAALFRDRAPAVDEATVTKRRKALTAWLKRNHVEVRESGSSLLVFGSARIVPPFSADDCHCDNAIVLKRIRGMIERCPSE